MVICPVRRETMARSVERAASTQAEADLDCGVGMTISAEASEQWLNETDSTMAVARKALS